MATDYDVICSGVKHHENRGKVGLEQLKRIFDRSYESGYIHGDELFIVATRNGYPRLYFDKLKDIFHQVLYKDVQNDHFIVLFDD